MQWTGQHFPNHTGLIHPQTASYGNWSRLPMPEWKKEIEELISGGTIKKPVHEEITYEDIHTSQDNLWNFLFFTGYLKMTEQTFEDHTIYLTLQIPNEEIRYIYRNTIREWFNKRIAGLWSPFQSGKRYRKTGTMPTGCWMKDIIRFWNMGSVSVKRVVWQKLQNKGNLLLHCQTQEEVFYCFICNTVEARMGIL